MAAFKESYIDKKEPLHFRKLRVNDSLFEGRNDVQNADEAPAWKSRPESTESEFDTHVTLSYTLNGKDGSFEAVGNGPIDAVIRGIRENFDINVKVLDYEEHALQGGANAQAAAYIHLLDADDGRVTYGVGVSSNITRASVRAMFSAINRLGLL